MAITPEPRNQGPPQQPSKTLNWWVIGLLAFTLLVITAVRLRLADTPLERDEGEFAYGGMLIQQGEIPYNYLYNIKLPGTYAAYAVIMTVFGSTPVGIHIGLLITNVLCIFLVYLLGKKHSGAIAGATAALFFGFLTLFADLNGFAAHATHFVILTALCGFNLALRAIEKQRFVDAILSGVFMGISFLCKQPGLFFGVLGMALFLACKTRRTQLCSLYFAGWIAPYCLLCLGLWATGSFNVFWMWTVEYARGHQLPISEGEKMLRGTWLLFSLPTRLLAAAALPALIFVLFRKQIPMRTRMFLIGLALCSLIAVVPGLYFYRHYFVMVAPSVALIVAIALGEIRHVFQAHSLLRPVHVVPLLIAPLWAMLAIAVHRQYLFIESPETVIAHTYGGNPFLQTRIIGNFLATHASPNARIAVLESEPEIFFYARRKSATGFIYSYDMLSSPHRARMQEQFKRELNAAEPEYVVVTVNPLCWSTEPEASRDLIRWCLRFARTNYKLVGVVDPQLPEMTNAICVWGSDAAGYTRRSLVSFEIYRRVARL